MLFSSIVYRITLFISSIAFALMLAPSTSSLPLTFAPSVTSGSSAFSVSRNWAGYGSTGGSFTSITSTWTVPQISSNGASALDATWIGIGGITSSDLIQSGTEDLISRSGQVMHVAFFELLPNLPQQIPAVVQGGDSITVTITERAVDQWQISFADTTNGQRYNITTHYHSSLSSAEWIEEAPTRGGKVLHLNNFGMVAFSNGSTLKNQSPVTIAQSNALPITMVNSKKQVLATPSSINANGAGFTVVRSGTF